MSLPLLSTDTPILDPDSGQWVNAKHQRIAEIINDFDPTLHLFWIPPATRDPGDSKPYALCQDQFGKAPYVIFYLHENELDERIIARLFEARRMASGNVGALAARLEAQDAARELVQAKARLEASEIARDKANFLWNQPLHTVRMDGKVFHL